MNDFTTGVLIVVGSIILLKVFFTVWGPVHRKLNPESVQDTPESAFKDLKGKTVRITMMDGSVAEGMYEKTLYFNDGEMGLNSVVFFQLRLRDGRMAFMPSTALGKIEEASIDQGAQAAAHGTDRPSGVQDR